jgi:hypothetical protein
MYCKNQKRESLSEKDHFEDRMFQLSDSFLSPFSILPPPPHPHKTGQIYCRSS